MNCPNPYSVPSEANTPAEAAAMEPPWAAMGIWRDGNKLVMHRATMLPNICVKSNLPTMHRIKCILCWHHPALALSVVICALLYPILVHFLRKQAVVLIPFSEKWLARRRRGVILSSCLFAVGALMLSGALAILDHSPLCSFLFMAASAFLTAGISIGFAAGPMISPSWITNDYVWIKGVSREYLDRLPVWPY